MAKKGKLIVIDGIDGSGKATQTELLMKHLKKNKIRVKTLDFPRYYDNFMGGFIGECLAGKHGNFVSLDPYIASVLYATDRFESKKKIEKWLSLGYTVILDRYVSSNQIHQGGKIKSIRKRKKFLVWLDKMEYIVFKLPRPDLIIFLNLPVSVARKLLNKKLSKKRYTKKVKDTVEKNLIYLKNSRMSARELAKGNKWFEIDCSSRGNILPREEIHEMLLKRVMKFIK